MGQGTYFFKDGKTLGVDGFTGDTVIAVTKPFKAKARVVIEVSYDLGANYREMENGVLQGQRVDQVRSFPDPSVFYRFALKGVRNAGTPLGDTQEQIYCYIGSATGTVLA